MSPTHSNLNSHQPIKLSIQEKLLQNCWTPKECQAMTTLCNQVNSGSLSISSSKLTLLLGLKGVKVEGHR